MTTTAVAPQPIALPNPLFAGMFQKKEDVGPPKLVMIYGPPGTRKTSMIGDLLEIPGFNKILIIDTDNGSEVFANFPKVHAAIGTDLGMPGEKRINIIPIDKTDPDAYGKLRYLLGERGPDGVFIRGAVFDLGYDAIVIDTANVMQEIAVQWLTSNTFNDRGALNTQAAWGKVSEWTSDIGWVMQNNATSVGFWLAHSKAGTDDGGKYEIKPKFQGGIKDGIAAIPSLVAYVEKTKHADTGIVTITATLDGDVITSKNRYSLPDTIESFDLIKLYAMIAERREATHSVNNPTSVATPAAVSV
jgi:hypothetical protein